MHIAIIGAGLTGLTAGYELQKKGHTVTIFEKEKIPGGLAIGFQKALWEWPLEKHYHHIFESDTAIRNLAEEIGVTFRFSQTNTSSLVDNEFLQLTPLKLLTFSKLSIVERIRMGIVLAYLKYIAIWRNLEGSTAHDWCIRNMGKRPYEMLWEPLMIAKFGPHYKTISMSWFWARIKARTPNLGYPDGGFQHLSDVLAEKILKAGGSIQYSSAVENISTHKERVEIRVHGTVQQFDRALVTIPHVSFMKIASTLPPEYKKKLLSFKGIGALNMVLELDAPFFKNDVYWLSICEKKYPFLAVVEHTNFIDKGHYGARHLVYVGNYLPAGHAYFKHTEKELLSIYDPFLKKLSPDYAAHLQSVTTFSVPFAQPIVTANFSKQLLPHDTPMPHVYLANIQQVYPWDRGTNFAVEMGKDAACYLSSTI
ncbi:FAD-dependent oxidoreductase [Candidatus Woesebacteria bacterium]|nr:FAD-dependent oxidoreductase [Candidatus Woesebacteria bacterium]